MVVEHVGTVIVGLGVCGLKAASRLSQDGNTDFIVLEKNTCLGGVWATNGWANVSSRVQISEPNYRLADEGLKGERNPSRTTTSAQGQEDKPPAASGAERGGFNVGGSVVVMSDFYLEVYAYFRDHPEELASVLPLLPNPKINEDSYQVSVTC